METNRITTVLTNKEYRNKVYEPSFSLLRKNNFAPADNFYLSAIGARICYSNNHPAKLIAEDEKVSNSQKRYEFLKRLVKAKHYSVFAHSPVFFWPHYTEINNYSQLYKAFIIPGKIACLNGRHLVEAHQDIFESWIKAKNDYVVEILQFDFVGEKYWTAFCADLDSPQCLIAFIMKQSPWHWLSILAHGFSRVMTHQFVRHTYLNFSQRSHRYTETDGYVIPQTAFISDVKLPNGKTVPANLFYEESYNNADYTYAVLRESGIPKEDARFVAPNGSRTTIMASGPYFVWEDFVEKRAIAKAQWEIRQLATAVKFLLEDMKGI